MSGIVEGGDLLGFNQLTQTNTDLIRDFLPAAEHLSNEGFSGNNKKCDSNISKEMLRKCFCTSIR